MTEHKPLISCDTIRRETTSAMRLVPRPTNADFEALQRIIRYFNRK